MTKFDSLYDNSRLNALLPPASYVRGFTFAVATCPDIPMPEEWMPWVVTGGGSEPTAKELDELAEGLMEALRENLAAMRLEAPLLPMECTWSNDKANRQALELWLTGLLKAHKHLEAKWQTAWTLAMRHPKQDRGLEGEAPDRRLHRCLKLFTTLADAEFAIQGAAEKSADTLRENLPVLYKQLPALLKDYVTLSGELALSLPNQFETFTKTQST